jgi:RNA polymerase sigma-70 factor, ECF subfamily
VVCRHSQADPADSYEYRDVDVSRTGPDAPDGPQEAAPPGRNGLPGADLAPILAQVARGDQDAFRAVYDRAAGQILGVVRRVVRDPAQSEEVSQEVLLDVWRTAARFDPAKGTAATWVMTIAHRRAVDRVRSATAAAAREVKSADVPAGNGDEVADTVEASLDAERVRRCLDGLTEPQRESITLAYYGGYSYRQVGERLGVALSTIKTRIRDGLIRMRDCLGVSW